MCHCSPRHRRHQLPSCPFKTGPDTIIPPTAVRDLGIYIDSDLSTQVHVQRSVAGCFAVLRQLRSIDDLSRHLCISRWSSPLSYRDWTTEMRHWPVFRSSCLTQQRGRLPVSVVRSILQMLSPVSTGPKRSSASSSNWPSSFTELFTALHLGTYRTSFSTSLICRPDVEAGCARRPPVSSTSARRDLLL